MQEIVHKYRKPTEKVTCFCHRKHGLGGIYFAIGKVKQNVEPLPSSLINSILPELRLMISLQM
jgi:hypothetical protein